MIINNKSVQGIYRYSPNYEFEQGDFVVYNRALYICTANNPTNESNGTVSGSKTPEEDTDNYTEYPGERIISKEEFDKLIKSAPGTFEQLENKYVSAGVLNEILSSAYFGIDNENGVIKDRIKYIADTNTTTYDVLDTHREIEGVSENLLDTLIEDERLNNGIIEVSRNLPEVLNIAPELETSNNTDPLIYEVCDGETKAGISGFVVEELVLVEPDLREMGAPLYEINTSPKITFDETEPSVFRIMPKENTSRLKISHEEYTTKLVDINKYNNKIYLYGTGSEGPWSYSQLNIFNSSGYSHILLDYNYDYVKVKYPEEGLTQEQENNIVEKYLQLYFEGAGQSTFYTGLTSTDRTSLGNFVRKEMLYYQEDNKTYGVFRFDVASAARNFKTWLENYKCGEVSDTISNYDKNHSTADAATGSVPSYSVFGLLVSKTGSDWGYISIHGTEITLPEPEVRGEEPKNWGDNKIPGSGILGKIGGLADLNDYLYINDLVGEGNTFNGGLFKTFFNGGSKVNLKITSGYTHQDSGGTRTETTIITHEAKDVWEDIREIGDLREYWVSPTHENPDYRTYYLSHRFEKSHPLDDEYEKSVRLSDTFPLEAGTHDLRIGWEFDEIYLDDYNNGQGNIADTDICEITNGNFILRLCKENDPYNIDLITTSAEEFNTLSNWRVTKDLAEENDGTYVEGRGNNDPAVEITGIRIPESGNYYIGLYLYVQIYATTNEISAQGQVEFMFGSENYGGLRRLQWLKHYPETTEEKTIEIEIPPKDPEDIITEEGNLEQFKCPIVSILGASSSSSATCNAILSNYIIDNTVSVSEIKDKVRSVSIIGGSALVPEKKYVTLETAEENYPNKAYLINNKTYEVIGEADYPGGSFKVESIDTTIPDNLVSLVVLCTDEEGKKTGQEGCWNYTDSRIERRGDDHVFVVGSINGNILGEAEEFNYAGSLNNVILRQFTYLDDKESDETYVRIQELLDPEHANIYYRFVRSNGAEINFTGCIKQPWKRATEGKLSLRNKLAALEDRYTKLCNKQLELEQELENKYCIEYLPITENTRLIEISPTDYPELNNTMVITFLIKQEVADGLFRTHTLTVDVSLKYTDPQEYIFGTEEDESILVSFTDTEDESVKVKFEILNENYTIGSAYYNKNYTK